MWGIYELPPKSSGNLRHERKKKTDRKLSYLFPGGELSKNVRNIQGGMDELTEQSV